MKQPPKPPQEDTAERSIARSIGEFFALLVIDYGMPVEYAAKCAVIYMESFWGRK